MRVLPSHCLDRRSVGHKGSSNAEPRSFSCERHYMDSVEASHGETAITEAAKQSDLTEKTTP